MSKSSQVLKFKMIVSAPPAEIYRAFTQRMGLLEWLCDIAQTSGNLYLAWNSGYYVTGTFTGLIPNERVNFTWQGSGEPGISQVRVRMAVINGENNNGEIKTAISLSHHLPDRDSGWKKAAKEFRKGWENALQNLKAVLETGEDQRITQRPLLGFNGLRELTAEDTSFPASNGVLVTGVVEGMGAHQAGLQPGDLLVKAGGAALTNLGDLRSVVQKHKVKDTIKITFYRDAVKQRCVLTVSSMPIPNLPKTLNDLINHLDKNHRSALKSLSKVLAGSTISEAAFRPGPGEWNVQEVLAHMITGERAIHTFINGIVTGQGAMEVPYHYANNFSMNSLLEITSSPKSLFITLNRTTRETIQMLRSLPPEIASRKAMIWRMGLQLMFTPDHTREHQTQIENLLNAARIDSTTEVQPN